MPERRSKLFDFSGIRSSKFGASSNQKAPLRGPSLKSNKGLSSLRSDIPKGEVRAFTAHAGTSFLAFFIFGIRSGKPGSSPNKKCPCWGAWAWDAEREGFEPPDLLQSTVFKTAAIDHSAISPPQMYTQKQFWSP